MAEKAHITRRSVLATIGGALASSAALAVPAVAATEHPNNKVRRLALEIRYALRDPEYIGFKKVVITPSLVAYHDEPDDELIELAQQFKALVAAAYAAQDVAYDEQARAREAFLSIGGKSLDADWDEFSEFYDNSPASAADDAMHRAWERVDEVGKLIRSKPAIGLGGVWAKLVALQCDHGYRDAIPRRDQDLSEERFNTLLDEIGASAGLTI